MVEWLNSNPEIPDSNLVSLGDVINPNRKIDLHHD